MSQIATTPPRSGRQILSGAEHVYRRGFLTLVALAAVIYLPIVVVAFAVMNEMIPLGAGVADGQIVVGSQEALDRLRVILLVPTLLTAVALVLTTAALHFAIADQYLDGGFDLREALGSSLRRTGPVLGLFALTIIAIVAPWALLVASGGPASGLVGVGAVVALTVVTWIVATVGLFAVPPLMREDVGPLAAIGRSWAMLARSWWRITGLLIVTFLLVGIIWGIVGRGIEGLLVANASTPGRLVLGLFVSDAVPTVLLAPLVAAVVTVAYFDLRLRRGESLEDAPAVATPRPGVDPLGDIVAPAGAPPVAVPAAPANPAPTVPTPSSAVPPPPVPAPAVPPAGPAAPAIQAASVAPTPTPAMPAPPAPAHRTAPAVVPTVSAIPAAPVAPTPTPRPPQHPAHATPSHTAPTAPPLVATPPSPPRPPQAQPLTAPAAHPTRPAGPPRATPVPPVPLPRNAHAAPPAPPAPGGPPRRPAAPPRHPAGPPSTGVPGVPPASARAPRPAPPAPPAPGRPAQHAPPTPPPAPPRPTHPEAPGGARPPQGPPAPPTTGDPRRTAPPRPPGGHPAGPPRPPHPGRPPAPARPQRTAGRPPAPTPPGAPPARGA